MSASNWGIFHLIFSICCLFFSSNSKCLASESLFEAIYWESRPFIYINKMNNIEGIYPTLLQKAAVFCKKGATIKFVSYKTRFPEREQFNNAVLSNVPYGQGVLSNVSANASVMWFPYNMKLVNLSERNKLFSRRNLTLVSILSDDGLVVIQQQRSIEFATKVIRGIRNLDVLHLISFVLATIFGTVIWICEHRSNEHFKSIKGPFNGLYWSFVTMTTVGYGDVVPVTFFGRCLSVLWMFIGMIMASIMTATLTSVVTGTQGLELKDKTVGVVNNSYESDIVWRDHDGRPVAFPEYKHVIQAVRDGNVDAGVLPKRIAAYMQSEIHNPLANVPLSIIYEIEGDVPFDFLVNNNGGNNDLEALFKCMSSTYKYEIIASTLPPFQRRIKFETMIYGKISRLISNSVFVQAICGTMLCLVVISFIMSIYKHTKSKQTVSLKRIEQRKQIEDVFQELSILMKEYKDMLEKEGHGEVKMTHLE